jgi:hypothetical protein
VKSALHLLSTADDTVTFQGLPKGKRSLYQLYNEHAAIIMQIESKKGCENAQEILAVPGGQ